MPDSEGYAIYYQGALVTVLDEGRTSITEPTNVHETILPDTNATFICYKCGELWAKMTTVTYTEEGKLHANSYYPRGGICRSCGDGSLLQYGVLRKRSDQGLWEFGPKLIAREVELVWEKENGHGCVYVDG